MKRVYKHVCICVSVYVCNYGSVHLHVGVYAYRPTCVRMYECMYFCMYVCMYACMYVCMYVCVYVFVLVVVIVIVLVCMCALRI